MRCRSVAALVVVVAPWLALMSCGRDTESNAGAPSAAGGGGNSDNGSDAAWEDGAQPDGAGWDAAQEGGHDQVDGATADVVDDASGARAFDVVVVGAGSGGIAAAIQAARMGARVALVEETDWIGGQMTTAAVSTMDGGFGPPTDTGLYDEFRGRVKAWYADTSRFPPSGKSIGTCYWSSSTTCFEPLVGKTILEQMLGQTSVEVMLRKRVSQVFKAGNAVTGVQLDDGQRLDAPVVIDATEAGDVIPMTGAKYRIGNSESGAVNPQSCIQSLTWLAIIKKYPGGPPPELVMAEPPPGYSSMKPLFESIVSPSGGQGFPIHYPVGWDFHSAYRGVPDSSNPLDYTAAQAAQITKTGVNWANDYPGYRVVDVAGQQQLDWVDTLKVSYLEDPTVRRSANCQAKLATLGFIYYAQHELGHADWSIANDEGFDTPYHQQEASCSEVPAALKPVEQHMTLYPYLRESRRIVAVHTLTAREIKRDGGHPAPTNFPTSIAVGVYPTDLHNCGEDSELEGYLGETSADKSGSGAFQVPFESLIPETVDGLIAAEKNIGATRLANGAVRLQPITMATGQAAGAIAAIASREHIAPRQVSPIEVQRELLAAQSALSRFTYDDVPVSSAAWAHVQMASSHGIMVGTSEVHFDLAAPLQRAAAASVTARLFDLDTTHPPTTPSFADVPASHWAYGAIEAIYKAGITSGCATSPLRFCPDSAVTRAQLATLLVRGLGLDPSSASQTPLFGDVPIGHPLFGYVQLAAQQGILGDCPGSPGNFCPDGEADRAAGAEASYGVLTR